MKKKWRLIVDGKNSPFYNMAKDETIFFFYQQKKIPTLRIYQWQRPCVSLGYFQIPHQVLNIDLCQEEKIPFVRRFTGGGAILHQEELTYSISCDRDSLDLPHSVKESYKILSSFIFHFLRSLNLTPTFAKEVMETKRKDTSSFCFSSWEYFDILIGKKKFGGNAQKRRGEKIFQHGTLPLKLNFSLIRKVIKNLNDRWEEKITCLNSLMQLPLKNGSLQNRLIKSFQECFRIDFFLQDLDDKEEEYLSYLIKKKYTSKEWNYRFT